MSYVRPPRELPPPAPTSGLRRGAAFSTLWLDDDVAPAEVPAERAPAVPTHEIAQKRARARVIRGRACAARA